MNVIELAQSLISFKTESPDGNEKDCAKFLQDYIQDMHLDGFEAELHQFSPRRANLIVRIGSSKEAGLLLSGHIDTVPSGELSSWSVDPFGGQIRNGLLFGRGAADMKGGLAALVQALSNLQGEKLTRRILFIATAGEENGYIGLRQLIQDGKIRADESKWGVIGEPTEMKVVRKHKGVTRFRITVLGHSVHSSKPALGVNAIENASKYIEEIKQYGDSLSKEIDSELGPTVLPVTMIEGGIEGIYNVIPEKCEFYLNCRRIPNHSKEKIKQDLESISERIRSSDEKFESKIDIDFDSDGLQIAPESEFVRLTEDIVGEKSVAAPYGTEAPLYAHFGIPTIVLGPGSTEQAHVVDEFISIGEIEGAVSVYEDIIRSTCT